RLRQLLQRSRRLQALRRSTNRGPGGLGNPVRRAAVPALAPHLRLLDPTRQARLDRRAQPFPSCRVVEELRRAPTVEHARIEPRGDSLEVAEHLCEHASPSGPDTDRGSSTNTNICSPLSSPALEPLD